MFRCTSIRYQVVSVLSFLSFKVKMLTRYLPYANPVVIFLNILAMMSPSDGFSLSLEMTSLSHVVNPISPTSILNPMCVSYVT